MGRNNRPRLVMFKLFRIESRLRHDPRNVTHHQRRILRRSAGGSICEICGPALHELREGAIGVGGEQPDDLFVERQHLDLYGARREANGDIVAAERTVTGRHRILCNETHQQGDDQLRHS